MKELIDKFPNGQELYNTNAVFNKLIQCINNGMSLHEAVSILAKQNNNQQKLMEDLIMKSPVSPIIYTPDK